MIPKKVILIRHGDYNDQSPFNLSQWGKICISHLAVKLLSDITGKEVVFISSMANYAIQSAEILQKVWEENGISLSFEKKYEVWSGSDAYRESSRLLKQEQKYVSVHDKDWLTEFIKTSKEEIIIIVTHFEFVDNYLLEWNFLPPRITVSQSRALIMDFETMKCFVV